MSLLPGVLELKANGGINARPGSLDDLLRAGRAIRRARFRVEVPGVLQYRRQKLCKITCVLRIVHESLRIRPPRDRVGSLVLAGLGAASPGPPRVRRSQ